MARLSRKSAALTAAQNQMRGAREPWTMLSLVRARIPAADLPAFARWMPSVRSKIGSLAVTRFPRRVDYVRARPPLRPVSLAREISWASVQILEEAHRITQFVAFKAQYERALCRGDGKDCLAILDRLEAALGYSFWLIEARLTALQTLEGLEAQKSYLANILDLLPGGDVISFVAYHLSQRSEPSILPTRFSNAFATMTAEWDDASLAGYLDFRVASLLQSDEASFANLMRHETAGTIIDQYETLIWLASSAAANRAAFASQFDAMVAKLAAAIDDERLPKILLVRGNPAGIGKLDFIGDSATELALAGNAAKAGQMLERCIEERPNDPTLWMLKADVAATEGSVAPLGTLIGEMTAHHLQAFGGESAEGEFSLVHLLRFALTFRSLSFAAPVLAYTRRSLTKDAASIGPLERMAFIDREGCRAGDVAVLPAALHQAFLDAAGETLGGTAELARARLVVGAVGESETSLSEDQIFRARVEALLLLGEDAAALTMLLPKTVGGTTEQSRWAIRQAAQCLGHFPDAMAAARFLVDHAAARHGLARSLPIVDAVRRLSSAETAALKSELTLPILLHLAVQKDDGSSTDARAFAYEDFLLAHGAERPSELEGKFAGFDRSLLVYYLRYVCVPDIMQVSSAYQSTKELQDERIAVLRLLVELDPENAKAYEDELREIARSLLVHSGVRHVGQTKIFVDVPALRRWAERNLKEGFARLQSHLEAGLGVERDAVSAGLRQIAEGKPVPSSMFEIPKNDATDLIVKMISSLLREFLSNPDHGLDCYLSMRIRHGTLAGQLRTPLEVEHLITQRRAASEDYTSNEHWTEILRHNAVPPKSIDARLAGFSAEYDALIAEMSSELIQVHSADKPNGLFQVTIKSGRVVLFLSTLTPTLTFDQFLDSCFEMFWEYVDTCLQNVRSMCNDSLKPQVTQMFSSLEADVAYLPNPVRMELERAIRSAATGAHQALDLVADWFRLPAPIDEPDFPIEAMIDVGLQCVTTIYPDFHPDVRRDVPTLPMFRGALALFSDIFFIIFDNIRRHSGLSDPGVDLAIDHVEGVLAIHIASDLAAGIDVVLIESRLSEIRQRIEADDYRSAVTSEGGTGLIKLHRILNGGNRKGEVVFGIEDNRFAIDLNMEVRIGTFA